MLQSGAADQDSDRRVKAVDALGLLVKDDRARHMAEAALSDPDPDVRAKAATSLGEIGLAAAAPKLKQVLQDTESVVASRGESRVRRAHRNARTGVPWASA